jgi:pyruvate dehydrogenase E1 component alpha subunit
MTYRIGPHSTSDDPGRYRSVAEEQEWLTHDPLAQCAQLLGDSDFCAQTLAWAVGQAVHVRDGVLRQKPLPATDMFDHVFAEPTAELARQRAHYLRRVTQ